jgi:hypothetical protein
VPETTPQQSTANLLEATPMNFTALPTSRISSHARDISEMRTSTLMATSPLKKSRPAPAQEVQL